MDRRGWSGSTHHRKVASIRSFLSFLQDAGVVTVSPALNLIPPECERLRLACTHETRDAAIIEILLQTGMRLSELARLSLSHVQLPTKVNRDEGKRGRDHGRVDGGIGEHMHHVQGVTRVGLPEGGSIVRSFRVRHSLDPLTPIWGM